MKLLIVGAGGFGREAATWAEDVRVATKPAWHIAGYLDDDPAATTEFDHDLAILGPVSGHAPASDELFLMAIGAPRTKLSIGGALRQRGGRFLTLVHPTAIAAAKARLGEGCILCPYSCVTAGALLAPWTTLNIHATVGHDAVVGAGTTLSSHCDVTAGARLGEGTFLGTHSVVLPGVTVGDHAYVGAGSIVTRRVPAGATVFGVPARRISADLHDGRSVAEGLAPSP